ncbi:MAG TPA: hypothetical protein VD866_15325, partial [Urbifossiella sp.]|nr:hypothetical protein [Urbifossiella sp.]
FDAYMWQALETKARFIAQIMTGESGLRRAEDVGGQELSYAEVKAIASGNPAVLVLAEADAELQRLAVLRRNHADEQYLARKNLRELPQTIARLEQRIAALEADMNTTEVGDGRVVMIGGRPLTPQEPAFASALNRVPDQVERTRLFPVGTYRGLTFGIERHPGGATDVYLEGRLTRTAMLSKDSQGPRAVMNALHRIVGSYEDERVRAEQERLLAETQLGDYEARLGRPFAHAAYFEELTRLRDQLKVALSGTPPVEGAEAGPSPADLSERIKALRAGHAVEATPARIKPRKPETVSPRRRVEVIELPKEEPATQEPEPEEVIAPPSFREQVRSRPVQRSLF